MRMGGFLGYGCTVRQGVAGILLALAGCGGGGGGPPPVGAPPAPPPFGLTQRTQVQALAFPTTIPQPGVITAVRAFPNLAFNRPLFLTAPPDGSDRIFVAEQGGRIHVFPNVAGVTSTTVFLDISSRVLFGGEQGLLGLAFHPDYASNGFFYVN